MTEFTPEMRKALENDAEFYRAQAPGQVGEAMGVQEMLMRADAIETLVVALDAAEEENARLQRVFDGMKLSVTMEECERLYAEATPVEISELDIDRIVMKATMSAEQREQAARAEGVAEGRAGSC